MARLGIDILEVARIEKALARWGDRFLGRVFTPGEVALCQGRAASLAARFAAKEAVMKALGSGYRGLGWKDIEILADRQGRPLVHLHGGALARAKELGLTEWEVSLSHSKEYAVASVMGGGDENR